MKQLKFNPMDRNKEYYIIDCKDFTYFAIPVHIIGFGGYTGNIEYMIDIKDYDDNWKMVKEYELTKFRTLEEAQEEAIKLNNIPSNKKQAKEWNTKGKFQCEIIKQMMRW